jgi:5'(3')-deoxyribonucleotidase
MTDNKHVPTIFVDMDGVIADFMTGARNYLNASTADTDEAERDGRWPEKTWGRLVEAPNFFRHLPKMSRADELMNLAHRFRDELGWQLRILTAIPENNEVPDVFQDKVDWIKEYYPGIRVNFGPYSQDKWRQCKPGDILIDDRKDNCEQWQAAQGIAVRVTSDYQSALDQLQSLFDSYLNN